MNNALEIFIGTILFLMIALTGVAIGKHWCKQIGREEVHIQQYDCVTLPDSRVECFRKFENVAMEKKLGKK